MKIIGIIGLGLLWLNTSIPAHASTDPVLARYPEEVAAVKKAVNDIWESIRTGDLERLRDLHLNSEKFSKWIDGDGGVVGYEETVASELEFFGAIENFTYEVVGLRVDVIGPVAIATFLIPFEITMDDATISGKERATLVFAEKDGSWKIVHEHFSSAENQ